MGTLEESQKPLINDNQSSVHLGRYRLYLPTSYAYCYLFVNMF